jgi:hypothetical protein
MKPKKKNDSKIKQLIKKISNNNKFIIMLLIMFVILVCLPYLKLGIMHNDELMSRYWSSQGFSIFYKHYFFEQIEKGRTLSCIIIPLTMYLGFLGQKTISLKLVQTLSIIICSGLFSLLLKKVFNNKIAILYFVLFMVFLPISYEPTVPNVL